MTGEDGRHVPRTQPAGGQLAPRPADSRAIAARVQRLRGSTMQRSGERHQGEAKRVVGEWVLEHRIGTGSFSVVWKAVQRCGGGRTAAIKEIATERLSDKLRESLGSELSILRNTRHENIVSFYDILKVGTAGGGA